MASAAVGQGMDAAEMLFDLAHHELERACGLVRKAHPDPIDPQFRILCVDGHLRIAVTLTENAKERARRLALVSDFMAWKMALGFVLTSEIHEPDALVAVGLRHDGYAGLIRVIERGPLAFQAVKILQRDNVDKAMLALLPRGTRTINKTRLKELANWFGPNGRFPAVPDGND
jgi:hypothetical protein